MRPIGLKWMRDLTKLFLFEPKNYFLGSVATVITLLIATYFIIPFNSAAKLNSKEEITLEELSKSPNSSVEQQVVSSPTKKDINEVTKLEDNSSATAPYKNTTITEKTPITSSKSQAQITTTPALEVKEKETIISAAILPEESSTLEKNLKLAPVDIIDNKDVDAVIPAKEIINASETEKTTLPVADISKNKDPRYKPYKDENISKKKCKT